MLSKQQQETFKKRLFEMKEEAEEQMEKYREDQHDEYPNDNTGEISSVADHPGNLGTDQFEREKELTFYEQAREKLMEVNDALKRMEDGRYGLSEKSGEPIPLERLEAAPTARLRVDEATDE